MQKSLNTLYLSSLNRFKSFWWFCC